ncbi:MAG: hypothetical protein QM788_05715 [Roseateles sp.]|uniref:hypothetical protein n=1 Tax=Roseateles sp. TaxID=1971397 RepID=UPI0039EC99ED
MQMNLSQNRWLVVGRAAIALIGALSMTAFATGSEAHVRWLVGGLFVAAFIAYLAEAKRRQGMAAPYRLSKPVLAVELVCVLCGLAVVVGRTAPA